MAPLSGLWGSTYPNILSPNYALKRTVRTKLLAHTHLSSAARPLSLGVRRQTMNVALTFSLLGQVLGRAVAATIGSAIAISLAILSGFFSGGGHEALFLAAALALFGTGWSFLPAIRATRTIAIVVLLGWLALAGFLAMFGASGVRGWLLVPWFLASIGLGVCLAFKPPLFLPKIDRAAEMQSGKNDT